MDRPAILVVEDHAAVREALGSLVRLAFPAYAVLECADTRGAMAAARARPPVLALVDVSLPDGSGIDLVARLTGAFPGLRVVVVTQHPAAVYASRAVGAGACGFVEKDRMHEELIPAIARALASEADYGA